VSNIPGARMLVKKTKFGVLFNTEDSKDLSEKIIYLIENMKIIKNKKNMDNVMAMLDNDKNAKEIIDIIER
jgi:glycosyltransferase involved in cell wall biosynthesis